jgi:hypothetical protein
MVGADGEAEEAGGADDDALATEGSPTPSGMVEVPEWTLTRRGTTTASVDDSVAAEIDASTRAARLDILSAAVCKLRMLFDCGECGDDEPMLEIIDCGRGRSLSKLGSLWRVKMMDSFRRMTPPSGSMDFLGWGHRCDCCGR